MAIWAGIMWHFYAYADDEKLVYVRFFTIQSVSVTNRLNCIVK